jgi:phosphatidylinositol glycan class B
VTYWSGAFALIVGLAFYAGRRLPILLAVALTIVVVHTALSHKEYRFIYPALPLIMTLVGIGSAGIAQRLRTGVNIRPVRVALLLIVPLFWIVTSLILARSREFYPLWFRDRGSIEAMRMIDADPDACGAAIAPADMWDRSGGYAHLRQGVPLYGHSDADPAETVGAFNYLIAYKPSDFTNLGFTRLRCWTEPPGRTIVLNPICLWRRPGACIPDAAVPLTATPPVFLTQSHPNWFIKKK